MDDIYNRVKVTITGESNDDSMSLQDLDTFCPQLSYKQRLLGWLATLGVGILLGFLAVISILNLAGSPEKFAIPYTLCNVFLLASTFFLVGAKTQCRLMCAEHRALVSVVYVISLVLTLVVAFSDLNKLPKLLLVLLFVTFQVVCLVWYSLSFIPYGRSICYSCCCKGDVSRMASMGSSVM